MGEIEWRAKPRRAFPKPRARGRSDPCRRMAGLTSPRLTRPTKLIDRHSLYGPSQFLSEYDGPRARIDDLKASFADVLFRWRFLFEHGLERPAPSHRKARSELET